MSQTEGKALPGQSLLFVNDDRQKVTVCLDPTLGLSVKASSGSLTSIPIDAVESGLTGQLKDRLVLSWTEDNNRYQLFINQVDALMSLLPNETQFTPLRETIHQAKSQTQKSTNWMKGLVLVFVAAVILFFGGIWLSVPYLVDLMPPEWDKEVGDTALKGYLSSRVIDLNSADLARVKDIVEQLAFHLDSPYAYEVVLIEDSQVNAMALPGGKIIINSGLVEAVDKTDELAAVIAHEMSHIENRHGLHSLVQSLGVQVGVALITADASLLNLFLNKSHELASLSYSRSQELAADQQSIQLMQAVGRDPLALADFLEKQESHFDSAEFLKTHPNNNRRIAAIRASVGTGPLD